MPPEVRSRALYPSLPLPPARPCQQPIPSAPPLYPPPTSTAMALKRKFDAEFDDAAPTVSSYRIQSRHARQTDAPVCSQNGKQAKLVPFPHSSDLDSDVAMSDASMSDLEPLSIPSHPFHVRLPSNASYASSSASESPRNSRKSRSALPHVRMFELGGDIHQLCTQHSTSTPPKSTATWALHLTASLTLL